MKKTILSICMAMTIFGTLAIGQVNNEELYVNNKSNDFNQAREYILNM